jgi:alternative ribosome-rescue factor
MNLMDNYPLIYKGKIMNKKLKETKTDIGRGAIKGNFLAALVTSKVYKMQIVKAKKGKGSYMRKAKFKKGESYLMAA